MARNETITLEPGVWTQLTNADVSSVTFQNKSSYDVFVTVQNGTTTPTDMEGALVYPPRHGEAGRDLVDLAPGVSTPNRVFAYSKSGAGVFISHA